MRSADLRRATLRVRGVGAALLLCFGLLSVRAAHLALVDPRGHDLAPRQTSTVLRLAPARGAITDRNGAELAVTVPAPSLYAVPSQVTDARNGRRRARSPARSRLPPPGSSAACARGAAASSTSRAGSTRARRARSRR